MPAPPNPQSAQAIPPSLQSKLRFGGPLTSRPQALQARLQPPVIYIGDTISKVIPL